MNHYRPIASAVLILGLITSADGCMSSGTNYDQTQVSQIKKGQTTEAQLVQMFGEPTQRMTDGDGNNHLTWTFTEAQANAASYVPVVGLFAGGTNGTTKSLFVTTKNGVVTDYRSSTGTIGNARGTTEG